MKTSELDDDKPTAADHQPSDRLPKRKARVTQDGDGDPIGVAVWLNADELAALGINPADTDAVEVRIEDGKLRLVPAGGDDDP